jgi:hypothetical protein
MFSLKKCISASAMAAACVISCSAGTSARASVLGSSAMPNGYSLSTLAADTAVYNTGIQSSNPATPAAPSIPFQVLEGTMTVPTNSYLYLPVFYADNSAPVDPAFPASIANQATDAAYLDNLVLTGFNVSAFVVQIDGQTTPLDDSYIVGVNTPTLLDGTPGGNEYITSAAVLSPLSAGAHTIGYGGVIGGQDVIFDSFTVTAVPEPASVGLLSLVACTVLRRRRTV